MSTLKVHAHGKSTVHTFVTASGVTFTACSCGVLMGDASPLSRRTARRIESGALLVTTPHRAVGAYGAREPGGIVVAIKSNALMLTFAAWVARDPRGDKGVEAAQAIARTSAVYAQ